ncbi:MAG: tyrosine-protein phosphatase [Pleomorphochaeta sp.]
MKKYRSTFLFLLVSFILVLSSCSTTQEMKQMPMEKEAVVYNQIEASIVAADKYGNLETDLMATKLMEEGYEYGDMVNIMINGVTYQAPIVSTYSDVDVGNFLIRIKADKVYFAINYGNCLKKTGASEGTKIVVSMADKGSYLLEYKTRHLTKSEVREDYSSDEVFANFRTVKIGDIKSDMIFRSCNPALADARAPYAEALAKKNNIKTIVNLADSKDSLMENIDTIVWYREMYENGKIILLDMDVDYTSDDFGQKLAKGFIFMSENEGPYLVHCNEGKDRAGFAAVVLEALMNATLEEIETDYMLSYANYYNVEKGTMQYDYIADTPYNMLKNIAGDIEVTNANLSMIAEKYLMKIGLTSKQIMNLKNNLK